ncbi:hypothetical protein JCM8202_000607 [Rhodotorula sphaerocarpa]
MAPPAKGPASSATSGKQPAKKSLKAVSQKAAKGGDGGEGKKKRKSKSRKESYKTYLYKVLKQVHPNAGISNKAMAIMDSFAADIFERIAAEAGKLAS